MPSDGIYRARFGSYGNAIKLAGLTIKKPIPGELCNKKRNEAHRGKRSYAWKGGRIIDNNGYVLIWKPEHPNANIGKRKAYVAEHRMVMADRLGRALRNNETVHHKNGDRADNRIENLELWDSNHPAGQTVRDKIIWARTFLEEHGFEVIGNVHSNPELLTDKG